ncbi:MAG TPA: response regulator, partial [Nitrospirales bacterium]|nr:response regulator [Nitrospirales bacterium]
IHRKNIETQLQSLTESLERRVDERTQDLLQHQHRLRQLSLDLILTEQRERRRIATELHDYLGQLLVVGKIKISQLQQADLSNQQAPFVREVEESLDEALQYTRDLIPQISPPILYEFGFMAAIRWLAEKMVRYDLHVTVTSHVEENQLNLSESVSIILYHVIRELLLNVMKHAQTQEASILIKQVSSEFFGIEVADRGCGFDLSSTRETHPHFEKFGLLNVQERVEGLGGECEVLSNVGEGTRVLIKMPFSLQDAELEPIQSTLPHMAVQVPKSGKSEESIRVVLADDHPIFREGLGTMLNACPDIQVVGEAENGEQAAELVQALHPDVVVMDINMPVMNGIEATRLIKASHPGIYIIGLSMHGDQLVTNNFAEAGGDEYVSKGDSFNSFAEVIRSSQKNR